MADPYRTTMRNTASTGAAETAEFDAGLRKYMLSVYNYMASGVLLTGVVAMVFGNMMTGNPELAQTLFASPLRWALMLAPLAFVMVLSFGVNRMSAGMLQTVFWAFAATMGVSMSWIFLVFTDTSIARVFMITAASFAGLSLFGYTTKRSLSGMGTFLMMGLIGIIIASVVNIFLQSTMMQFVLSVASVLVFAGLTAYDTQRIKQEYYYMSSGQMMAKGAVMSAVNLYLDFINMFMALLQLFGNRE